MVTKIIACSDIHIPSYKGIAELNRILDRFIEDCKNIVKKEGSPDKVRIVIAGDIFHNKTNITNESLIAFNDFLKKLNGICKTIIIAGNHDYLANNPNRMDSITPLFYVGDFKNIIYLDRDLNYKSGILIDDNIAWCLYSTFESFKSPDIEIEKDKNNKKGLEYTYVGLIHGSVNGATTSTNHVTKNALDGAIFKGCDFVIAGHIHKRQEIKENGVKIVYCSSISQKDFGETISGHGYVLWDVSNKDNITYSFVDIPNTEGGFYQFAIESLDDISNDFEELINL